MREHDARDPLASRNQYRTRRMIDGLSDDRPKHRGGEGAPTPATEHEEIGRHGARFIDDDAGRLADNHGNLHSSSGRVQRARRTDQFVRYRLTQPLVRGRVLTLGSEIGSKCWGDVEDANRRRRRPHGRADKVLSLRGGVGSIGSEQHVHDRHPSCLVRLEGLGPWLQAHSRARVLTRSVAFIAFVLHWRSLVTAIRRL